MQPRCTIGRAHSREDRYILHAGMSIAGFVLALVGLYLLAGLGWSLLVAGLVLFTAGGLGERAKVTRP